MPVGVSCKDLDAARRHLARIRCLQACVGCLEAGAPLPAPLAYVPAALRYGAERNTKVVVRARPARAARVLVEFVCSAAHVVWVGGEELCNTEGRWARFIKVTVKGGVEQAVPEAPERWVLLFSHELATTELLTPLKELGESPDPAPQSDATHKHAPIIDNWMDVVEHEYALRLTPSCAPAPLDAEGAARLRRVAPNWTLQQDEDLAQFLGRHVDPGASSLGGIKDYVDSIDVSSKGHGDGEENLTDNDNTTYWESDGSHGSHWIRLRMKKGVVIKKLLVTVGGGDSNYMPQLIHVMGGDTVDNLKKINDVTIDQSVSEIADVVILAEQTEYFPILEIRIKECKDHGIDTRIRGIKIKSCSDGDVGINRDLFVRSNLVRFPKLETFEQDVIYRRALILERMMKLLDSVLVYLVPLWDYSTASYASIHCGALAQSVLVVQAIRQLLPLSMKRMNLVDQFLGKTELSAGQIPKLYINRRAALEHRADPSQDPEASNSVFTQIFEGLKPKDLHQSPQHYRWGTRHDQWWECKFFSEGVIDQGGGFRDSVSDLSEELCPSGGEDPVPLPFFVRSPNQKNDDASNYRDAYVPNPACTEWHKYEWIGKLMGACLRGKEFLVLSLPSYFWKRLSGQPVSWTKDFITVDEYQVKSLEALSAMDEASFAAYFSGRARVWTATLSDGSSVALRPDGAAQEVCYANRLEYVRLVQEARLNESKKQIEAMQRGLLMVVPQAVLELLTCQELDRRICGDPEISVEALKRHIHFEDYQKEDVRVKFLWTTLENFSNEDRSRLIRFVTGRRRLPANMHIFWGDGSQDALPTSSTCGSALFLPNYSSAKVMEDKLRYAMYNCVSIDTDTVPLDDY